MNTQLNMFDIRAEDAPKWAVLDFETGGVDSAHHALCSVAIVRVDSEFKEVDRYYTLIIDYPDKVVQADALRVNGLTLEQIKSEGKPWSEVFEDIKNLLNGCIPVAHNAQFDYRFLKERGYPIEDAVCTMENDYKIFPYQKHKLGLVYNRIFGHDFVGAHNALDDVLATVEVLKWQVQTKGAEYGEPKKINWDRFKR